MITDRRTSFPIFMLIVLGLARTLVADDTQKVAEILLNRARTLSDIRSPNAPAFQLNLTFSFTGKDLNTLEGTYTEQWISNSQWRRETVVGNFRRIEVGGLTRRWLVDGGPDFPQDASHISEMVAMLPARTVQLEFESITESDSKTRCAVTKSHGEKQPKHAFCFDKASGLLVAHVAPEFLGNRFADYSCDYGQFAVFGDYWFPREMACFLDRHKKIGAKVVILSPAPSLDAALFRPPDGAFELGNCSTTPVAPQPLTTPHPKSPQGVRDRSSSVLLWMIVDVKGVPANLRVARSGGKQFDESALATVRGWHFKPGTCNGEPVPAALNLEVDFRSNR